MALTTYCTTACVCIATTVSVSEEKKEPEQFVRLVFRKN